MKKWQSVAWVVAFGVVFGLLAGGGVLLSSAPPRGETIRLLPPPTQPPLVVHVSGAVAHPGVFTLQEGSRVGDAIQAAGGLLPEADDRSLNLAAFVEDGDLIRIPLKPQTQAVLSSTATPPRVQGNSPGPSYPTSGPGLININTASLEALDTLPGIGPATAQKIIAYREENGPFAAIENIQDVSGIGPATFERIKDLITVEDSP